MKKFFKSDNGMYLILMVLFGLFAYIGATM